MGARVLSCSEVRSYLKQSVWQSSFTHWHVSAPCDSSEEEPAACDKPQEKHRELAQLTEVTLLLHHRVSIDFFPGYVTLIDYRENENIPLLQNANY